MIKGKKIYLCSVEPESLEQLLEWRNIPELRQYFREYRELNSVTQAKWYKKILRDKNQINFEIHDLNSDDLIGHCGLYYVHWIYRTAEFGIYIGDDEYRTGGYGSDSLRTLIKYGFDDLNLNRIWAECYSNNAACKIYEHIGFTIEGNLRQTVYKNGKYYDSIIFGLLKKEYDEIKEKEPDKWI